MARSFTQASTDKITVSNPIAVGSGTSMTWMFWVRNRATPGGSQGSGYGVNLDVFTYNLGRWGVYVSRATVASESIILNDPFTTDEDTLIIWTYSEANGIRIYRATLTTPPTEVSYLVQTVGSGATNSETGTLYWGNRGASNTLAPPWDMSFLAIYDSEFTAEELKRHWLMRRPMKAGNKLMWLIGDGGGSTQPDVSGNAKDGTITGTSNAKTVGLPAPWGWDAEIPSAVAGTTVTGSISEGALGGDSFACVLTRPASTSEGAVAGDTEAAIATRQATITDGALAGDDQAGEVFSLVEGSVTEGVLAGDTQARVATRSCTLSDGVLAGDSQAARADREAAATEGVLAGDTQARVVASARSVSEGALAGDTEDGDVSTLVTASLSEGALAGDTQDRRVDRAATWLDGAKAGDAAAARADRIAALLDGLKAGDAWAVGDPLPFVGDVDVIERRGVRVAERRGVRVRER